MGFVKTIDKEIKIKRKLIQLQNCFPFLNV